MRNVTPSYSNCCLRSVMIQKLNCSNLYQALCHVYQTLGVLHSQSSEHKRNSKELSRWAWKGDNDSDVEPRNVATDLFYKSNLKFEDAHCYYSITVPWRTHLHHFKEQSSLSWLQKVDVVGKKLAAWDRSKNKKNPGRILVVDKWN